MKHYLKTDPIPFRSTWNGQKTFEIRFDDRNYQVGDDLILVETIYTGAEMKEGRPLIGTGRVATTTVRYIMRGPVYGLEKGWVIMAHDVAKVCRAKMSEAGIPYDETRYRNIFDAPDSIYKGEF